MVFKSAYDLDGVLAVQPPKREKTWGKMKGPERKAHLEWLVRWYKDAPPIHKPREAAFLVITARKDNPEVRQATEDWLRRTFPSRVYKLFMLQESRSIKNVLRFKSRILMEHNIEDYVEDNREVVKGLRPLVPWCRIWHFKNGKMILDYQPTLRIHQKP